MTPGHPTAEVLQRYRDGALHGGERGDVEAHVHDCDECGARVRELEWLGGLMREVAEADAAAFHAERSWARVQAGLAAPPTLSERLLAWLTPARLLPAGGLIAAAAAAVVMLIPAKAGNGGGEVEAEVVSNECVVESVEAEPGRTVAISKTPDAQGATVIWFLAADDGDLLP